MTEATQIGTAVAQILTGAAASQSPSVTGSHTSTQNLPGYEAQLEHKRAFLAAFLRWERIFKRKDGEPNAEKWLIAEYYDSLGDLSEQGLETLTKMLKTKCTFFPSIKECLDAMACDRYDYGHPFRGRPAALFQRSAAMLEAPRRQIG